MWLRLTQLLCGLYLLHSIRSVCRAASCTTADLIRNSSSHADSGTPAQVHECQVQRSAHQRRHNPLRLLPPQGGQTQLGGTFATRQPAQAAHHQSDLSAAVLPAQHWLSPLHVQRAIRFLSTDGRRHQLRFLIRAIHLRCYSQAQQLQSQLPLDRGGRQDFISILHALSNSSLPSTPPLLQNYMAVDKYALDFAKVNMPVPTGVYRLDFTFYSYGRPLTLTQVFFEKLE